ncbi:MAG: hypothetical protein P8Y53_06645 [Pseudolabrys sp.]
MPRVTSTSLTFSLADSGALGNGEQPLLAVAGGQCEQIVVGEARRLGKDRARHLDRLVTGQRPHGIEQRVGDRRQAMGKLSARLGFDRLGQTRNHAVEHVVLFFAIAAGAGQEQVGHAPKHFRLLAGRAGGQRAFDLSNQRSVGHFNAVPPW